MLPERTANFFVDITGEISKESYKGDFIVKTILTIGEKRELEVEKVKLISDLTNPTAALSNLATIQAELKVRIIEAPNWWKESNNGDTFLDDNIIWEIFAKVIESANDWNNAVAERAGKKTAKGSAPKGGEDKVPPTQP